jgi:large subunit ribosomal protein L4
VFAPKPRDYSYSINKKERRLALRSALSAKASAGEIIVVDNLDMSQIKTKEFAAFLKAVGAVGKTMVVTPEVRPNVVKSARNIPGVMTTTATILSTYDILNSGRFVVDKAALAVIEEVFA